VKNTIRVSYRLPVEVAAMVEREAEESRRTKTAVLIIAVEDYIGRKMAAPVKKLVDTRRKR